MDEPVDSTHIYQQRLSSELGAHVLNGGCSTLLLSGGILALVPLTLSSLMLGASLVRGPAPTEVIFILGLCVMMLLADLVALWLSYQSVRRSVSGAARSRRARAALRERRQARGGALSAVSEVDVGGGISVVEGVGALVMIEPARGASREEQGRDRDQGQEHEQVARDLELQDSERAPQLHPEPAQVRAKESSS